MTHGHYSATSTAPLDLVGQHTDLDGPAMRDIDFSLAVFPNTPGPRRAAGNQKLHQHETKIAARSWFCPARARSDRRPSPPTKS